MQTRRKKYSVVTRPGGVPPPFGTNPVVATPFGPTPLPAGGIDVTPLPGRSPEPDRSWSPTEAWTKPSGFRRDMRRGSSPRELMIDIDKVVSHDPGTRSVSQLDTRVHKSSVCSMYQSDQPADKIEMRLLVLEESQRSEVMHKLVTAFQQKVMTCFDHYKPELTLSCLRIVTAMTALKSKLKLKTAAGHCEGGRRGEDTRKTASATTTKTAACSAASLQDPFAELDVEEALTRELPNFTVSRLRATVQQLLRHATLKQDGTLYFTGTPEASIATKSVQYFIWFFDFMDYLQELFTNFVEKIFTPLFKFFHDHAFMNATGRAHSISSAFSQVSQFSETDSGHFSPDRESTEEEESLVEQVRMRAQARASLLQLSKDFRDIRAIYDTTEIDKISQRLSFVKEQLDYLLDEEDEVDPDIYSEESGRMVEHLDMDFGTENFIRLVPDMLVKLKKSAWLARRWLELDDQRTKDVCEKVEKLSAIEELLSTRVEMLEDDITKGERKLERETDQLSRLMEKEGRCDTLTFKTYSLESHIQNLKDKLEKLNAEKNTFEDRLKSIVRSRNMSAFQKLKFQYESNKLERFVTSRKLSTLAYQKGLMADDLDLELLLRPSVIHVSNKLQDECEHLEQVLRVKREEVVNIKRALMPVQEDRASLTNRLMRQREAPGNVWQEQRVRRNGDMFLYPGHALYLRSLPVEQAMPNVMSLSGPHHLHGVGRPAELDFISRQRLVGACPAGNNRALRTRSPPFW